MKKGYNGQEELNGQLASGNGGKDAHPVAVGQDVVKAPGYAVDENGLDLAGRDPQLTSRSFCTVVPSANSQTRVSPTFPSG